MPGAPDQEKIYTIRSLGLNMIMHFSNEQHGSVDKAGISGQNSQ